MNQILSKSVFDNSRLYWRDLPDTHLLFITTQVNIPTALDYIILMCFHRHLKT